MGILLYSHHVSPCFFNCFPFFHPFVHVPGAASSCASCASAVRPTPNHASWWEKWAPPACCATRSKCRPDWDATWVLKKNTHHSWSWLLFIDYLTIMIQTIVHWLLDYYCLLLLSLLFTIYLSSFPIDYSLITLIHYPWWQTLFVVIWNITINWLLFIDYLTIMIDHSPWVFCFLLTKQPLQGGSTATVASVGRISPKSAKLMAFSPHAAGGRTGRNGMGFLSEATPNSWMVFISWKDPPSFLMGRCTIFMWYVQ